MFIAVINHEMGAPWERHVAPKERANAGEAKQ